MGMGYTRYGVSSVLSGSSRVSRFSPLALWRDVVMFDFD